MRIIKCNFCKKEIKEGKYTTRYFGMNMKQYDLCNKCNKKYEKIIEKYRKEINELEAKETIKMKKEIEELTKGEK